MKITANQLKELIRESMEEMDMDDEKRKAMLASEYSDVYKEKNGIRPHWMNWREKSIEELEGMLDDIHAMPSMIDDDYSDEERDAEYEALAQRNREADEEAAELRRMQKPEEGEEFVGQEGMGRRHLHETIKLMVSEILEEAKAKKYKGKSMRKGGGGRFAKLVDTLKASGKSEESAKAIAASAGRAKYGAKEMAKMAKAGKKRAAKK